MQIGQATVLELLQEFELCFPFESSLFLFPSLRPKGVLSELEWPVGSNPSLLACGWRFESQQLLPPSMFCLFQVGAT